MINNYDEEGLDELCNSVILQACKDYKEAYKKEDVFTLDKLDMFFYSEEFQKLTNHKIDDPEFILKELRSQVEEQRQDFIFTKRRTAEETRRRHGYRNRV